MENLIIINCWWLTSTMIFINYKSIISIDKDGYLILKYQMFSANYSMIFLQFAENQSYSKLIIGKRQFRLQSVITIT